MVPANHPLLATLAGAWSLVNKTSYFPNGTISPPSNDPLGSKPVGIIAYTSTGWVTMNSMATEPALRPDWLTWPPQDNQTDADWAVLGRHTYSYAGPVTDVVPRYPTAGSLVHGPLTFSNIPAQVGTAQHRDYELLDDASYLQLTVKLDTGNSGVLVWHRLPAEGNDDA
ncbi:uncharacterized protein JN550_013180 [Neoarthrinium moseri]|uniref:uncharacterized protein n=1 Tax=Neoarthrinium moseri TaxID=1658444 RepID=UPI001FDE8F1F|nr:uncharacterized protein JN550_013180 [Neoarthrinium moseri]KAI1857547.1 hypothetical protein JN550_013180 [Neoarthrinium moseri]